MRLLSYLLLAIGLRPQLSRRTVWRITRSWLQRRRWLLLGGASVVRRFVAAVAVALVRALAFVGPWRLDCDFV